MINLGETWIRGRVTIVALGAAIATTVAITGPASAAVATAPSPVASASAPATYVVRGHEGGLTRLLADLAARHIPVVRSMAIIDAAVVRVSAGTAQDLAADPAVVEVTADAAVQLQSSTYTAATDPNSAFSAATLVGAHDAWMRGYTGRGIDVALIDSGVTPVLGLAGAGQVINGPDLSFESQHANTIHLDTFGHGTFMAGLIDGRDPGVDANPFDSADYQGIAPDARVVSVKVADAQGRSDVSQVIAGIDWVVQHAHDPGLNIRVLNLSFGTDSKQSYVFDPLAYAAEVAWRKGIVVVVSAGNSGGSTIADPAMDPYVIAVGALDTVGTLTARDDTVASFSAKGSTVRRPDLIAPGVHVQGLRVPNSFIDTKFGSTGRLADRFFRGNGTSEAAAITSGLAALVLSHRPALTPDQVKHMLMATALKTATGGSAQGSGVPNASRAALATPGLATQQKFTLSKGTGTLQGARGSSKLTLGGVTLTGEQDIFGKAVGTSKLAASELAATSWSGGTWNGTVWTGASWDGASWDGASWDGASWDGASWDGASWDGASWDGASWDGASWQGASWDGATWDGASWAGASWNAVVSTAVTTVTTLVTTLTTSSWASSNWMGGSWS